MLTIEKGQARRVGGGLPLLLTISLNSYIFPPRADPPRAEILISRVF